jgi:hypothetical protein
MADTDMADTDMDDTDMYDTWAKIHSEWWKARNDYQEPSYIPGYTLWLRVILVVFSPVILAITYKDRLSLTWNADVSGGTGHLHPGATSIEISETDDHYYVMEWWAAGSSIAYERVKPGTVPALDNAVDTYTARIHLTIYLMVAIVVVPFLLSFRKRFRTPGIVYSPAKRKDDDQLLSGVWVLWIAVIVIAVQMANGVVPTITVVDGYDVGAVATNKMGKSASVALHWCAAIIGVLWLCETYHYVHIAMYFAEERGAVMGRQRAFRDIANGTKADTAKPVREGELEGELVEVDRTLPPEGTDFLF